MRGMNRNIKLLFAASVLNGVAQGMFTVDFNLFVLSLGISPGVLGAILSANPAAQALGSIPVGFLMEKIGYRRILIIVYGVAGIARLAQVATPHVWVMSLAAFIGGLALAGDFVVRLPFLAANSTSQDRPRMYATSSILYNASISLGALLAGYGPNLVQNITGWDLSRTYQATLIGAALVGVCAFLPCLGVREPHVEGPPRKISLAPYLWGMDRYTVRQAVTSLFVGISLGLTTPFMNIYFLYHLGTNREFFGTVSALVIIPAMIATALGPLLSARVGQVRAVTLLRSIIPFLLVNLAVFPNRWGGTLSYWGTSALNTTAQPISFAFAMQAASKKAKSACSAWLNVTFWLGNAAAAPLAGAFMVQSNYRMPLFIAAGSILIAGVLNQIFFARIEESMKQQELLAQAVRIESEG
ncbi:MAG TPA: MFS transporter [Anaerolineaceae bacterium]